MPLDAPGKFGVAALVPVFALGLWAATRRPTPQDASQPAAEVAR